MRSKPGFVLVLVVPFALILALAVLAWGQQPIQTRTDGTFASYSLTNPIVDAGGVVIGSDYKYVYVSEGMGTGGMQWRLSFTVRKTLYASSPDPQFMVQLTGSGPIPDDCVTLAKPQGKRLALLVDVTTLPTSPPLAFGKSKTWSPAALPPNPSIDMDFGVIELQWEWISGLWNRTDGHSVLDFGDYWQHQQGSSESDGAIVWGSVFGFDIFPVEIGYPPGRMGQQRTITTTHYK
jgi:hypothetical protein